MRLVSAFSQKVMEKSNLDKKTQIEEWDNITEVGEKLRIFSAIS